MTTYQQQQHQNRYQRNGSTVISRMFGTGPYLIAITVFLIVLVGLICLVIFDPITGQLTVEYLANGNETFAWLVSGGTTGLAFALIGAGMYGYRSGWSMLAYGTPILLSLVPMCVDVYFDGLAADVVRFGHIVTIASLPLAEQTPHMAFRVLVSSLSFCGEPIAAMSVIVFPVLRELFLDILRGGAQ